MLELFSSSLMPFAAFLLLIVYQAIWCLAESRAVAKFRPAIIIRTTGFTSHFIPGLTGITALVISIMAMTGSLLHPPQFSWGIVTVGMLCGTAGIYLRCQSIRALGPLFRDTIDLAADHRLVKDGFYRFMKHPAETGFILAMFGLTILSGSTLALIAFFTLQLPLSLIRITLENRIIRARFGRSHKTASNLS